MNEKKERSRIKWILFLVFYLFFFTPISLIGYQLTPYIIEDKKINLLAHIQETCLHPIQKMKEIPDNPYWYVFVIMELIGLVLSLFYLNPKREAGYQVVGRTIPVHGSASWGTDRELREPENVHFRKKAKQLKKDLEKSMKKKAK
ncbi:hypothetical protein GVK96_01135 [Enterococcus hirae]|uniref:hypothetical protein n=1 Tax=Enterococcus hirae TaxID=1354 RepID=UPI001378D553|nr:hypothetical protein [Enterococcus hirae]NBA38124.1 hypothetical protein [Enterococcus hirae]